MTASIEFTAHGARISGHPTFAQWQEAYTRALDLGAASTWSRTDLWGFAEDERPYGDEHYQALSPSRLSEGTVANDRRRYKRFPYGHDLRRFMHSLSPSCFDAVAPLSDTDAEIVFTEALAAGKGREYCRKRVKELQNIPDPDKARIHARVVNGKLEPLEPLPAWAREQDVFEFTLVEKVAA